MNCERKKIEELYEELIRQQKLDFPKAREYIEAPNQHGIYIIYRRNKVMHIGRTLRGKNGLRQRLKNHLHGNSIILPEIQTTG